MSLNSLSSNKYIRTLFSELIWSSINFYNKINKRMVKEINNRIVLGYLIFYVGLPSISPM